MYAACTRCRCRLRKMGLWHQVIVFRGAGSVALGPGCGTSRETGSGYDITSLVLHRETSSSPDTTAVTPVRGPMSHAPRRATLPLHITRNLRLRLLCALEMSTSTTTAERAGPRTPSQHGAGLGGAWPLDDDDFRLAAAGDWLCGLRDRWPEAGIQRSVCACGKGWFPSGFPIADLGILVGTPSS